MQYSRTFGSTLQARPETRAEPKLGLWYIIVMMALLVQHCSNVVSQRVCDGWGLIVQDIGNACHYDGKASQLQMPRQTWSRSNRNVGMYTLAHILVSRVCVRLPKDRNLTFAVMLSVQLISLSKPVSLMQTWSHLKHKGCGCHKFRFYHRHTNSHEMPDPDEILMVFCWYWPCSNVRIVYP